DRSWRSLVRRGRWPATVRQRPPPTRARRAPRGARPPELPRSWFGAGIGQVVQQARGPLFAHRVLLEHPVVATPARRIALPLRRPDEVVEQRGHPREPVALLEMM